MRITGKKTIKIGLAVTGGLELTYWEDGSMTAFYTQPAGDMVYLTYSDLKIFKAALEDMPMNV